VSFGSGSHAEDAAAIGQRAEPSPSGISTDDRWIAFQSVVLSASQQVTRARWSLGDL